MVQIIVDDDFERWYISEIRSHFRNKQYDNYDEVDTLVKSRLCMKFSELLILKPDNLKKIATDIKLSYPLGYSQAHKELFENLYKSFRSSISSKHFIDKLNLKVCPYCNRNYIHSFRKKQSLEATAQLDHFYDKSKYPYLALSMYNLVPSCSTCNLRKSANDVVENQIFNPYNDNLDNHVKFTGIGILSITKSIGKGLNFDSEERMNLRLKKITSDIRTDSHIKSFNIEELYKCHKDIVVDLYQKRVIYSDEYVNELFESFEGKLFSDKKDLLKLIACTSIKQDEVHKRPLSKLTRDISIELGFI